MMLFATIPIIPTANRFAVMIAVITVAPILSPESAPIIRLMLYAIILITPPANRFAVMIAVITVAPIR